MYANWVSLEIEWKKKRKREKGGSLGDCKVKLKFKKREKTKKEHKKTQRKEKNWNGQRRMNFCYFHVSEQKDSLFLHLIVPSTFCDFYFILKRLWFSGCEKKEMDFLSRHSLINIKKLDTKDYLWIAKKKSGVETCSMQRKTSSTDEKRQNKLNISKKETKWKHLRWNDRDASFEIQSNPEKNRELIPCMKSITNAKYRMTVLKL